MRLSVSSLAFSSKITFPETCKSLARSGILGIEVAPTKYWPNPSALNYSEVTPYLDALKKYGLSVSGLQSLLFNQPDLSLFNVESWTKLRSHFFGLIDLCSRLESSILVFGSPKNRVRGNLNRFDANILAGEFFYSLEESLKKNGVVMTIEPNASSYGCDWVNTYADALEFTSQLNSPWISPQIDTGSQISEGENLIDSFVSAMPAHIHVSESGLNGFSNNPIHSLFGDVIRRSDYSGWIVLEMLNVHGSIGSLDELSVINFLNSYSKAPHGNF